MKISAYYKSKGCNTQLLTSYDNLDLFDKIFISKVFTDTEVPEYVLKINNVEYGGTGFYYDKAPPLPPEIEHFKPDYHLYDDWVTDELAKDVDQKELIYYTGYSIGFMTRGCIRQCSFCVNKNYKQCNLHSPLSEFLDTTRSNICLLDDNVLACKDWRNVFKQLQESKMPFQFKQGMDERLLTDEKCDIVFKSRWIGDYIFAFDNIKDKDIIETKLKIIRKHTNVIPKFYVFCGFNHDDPDNYTDEFWKKDIADLFERIKILMKYKCLPYIMRYKDYELSPYRGIYINISRWCNQPSYYKKQSLREFIYVSDGKGRKNKYYASKRYMEEFQKSCPDIATKYFDMKYELQ